MIRRSAPTALVAGAAVGSLGGLIGLGGAEFRLPVLVQLFGYGLRRAVTLNLAASLVTVAAAAAARVVVAPRGAALEHLGVVAVAMAFGGMIGARPGRGGSPVSRSPICGASSVDCSFSSACSW